MARMICRAPIFAAIAVITITAAHAAEPVDLIQDEIFKLVNGKQIDGKHTEHHGPFRLDFRDDGTLYGIVEGRRDSGTWVARDGMLCLKWRRWVYDGCGKVQKLDSGQIQHLWPDGRVHFISPAK